MRRWTTLLFLALFMTGPVACGRAWEDMALRPRVPATAAQFRGLEGRSVAVLVTADDRTLFEHPGIAASLCRSVCIELQQHVKGIRLTAPDEAVKFTQQNPYWETLPPSALLKQLAVERVVLINLAQYRTHEPGNAHVWQGMAYGEVSVADADNLNADNWAFRVTVSAQYPRNKTIGVVNSSDPTIELGLDKELSLVIAAIFADMPARYEDTNE